MTVFIADPSLVDFKGHHFELTRNISDCLIDQGNQVVWLVNKNACLQTFATKYVTIDEAFEQATYDAFKHSNSSAEIEKKETGSSERRSMSKRVYQRIFPVFIRAWISPKIRALRKQRITKTEEILSEQVPQKIPLTPEQQLYRSLKRNGAVSTDIVLFHTSDLETYKMVATFFEVNTMVSEWNVFPTFVLSTPYDEFVMPHNRGGRRFLRHLSTLERFQLLGKRVFLAAENALLADHLSKLSGLTFNTLPIPFRPTEDSSVKLGKKEEIIEVRYLGAARTEKGFNLLPNIISEFYKRNPESNVRFCIQVSPQIIGYTPDITKALEALESLVDPRITLVYVSQSPDEYCDALRSAEVLLLLYDTDRYRVRGSGIAIEAIMYQATTIVSQGTFPHFVGGKSSIAVDAGNMSSVVNALEHYELNRGEYRSCAYDRSIEYQAENSPKVFFENLSVKGIDVELPILRNVESYVDSTPWKKLL